MAVQVLRRLFTVEEYHRIAQAGILGEDDRAELIDGEIVEMAPIGARHAAVVARLTQLFSEQVERRAIVWIQNPIRLGGYSEPQPDVSVLQPQEDFYASAHPGPEDILLIVEVAEASAEYDREVKVPLYARFRIPEVWLVNLEDEVAEVYREPSPEGYRTAESVSRGAGLSPKYLPALEVSVEKVLGRS